MARLGYETYIRTPAFHPRRDFGFCSVDEKVLRGF